MQDIKHKILQKFLGTFYIFKSRTDQKHVEDWSYSQLKRTLHIIHNILNTYEVDCKKIEESKAALGHLSYSNGAKFTSMKREAFETIVMNHISWEGVSDKADYAGHFTYFDKQDREVVGHWLSPEVLERSIEPLENCIRFLEDLGKDLMILEDKYNAHLNMAD